MAICLLPSGHSTQHLSASSLATIWSSQVPSIGHCRPVANGSLDGSNSTQVRRISVPIDAVLIIDSSMAFALALLRSTGCHLRIKPYLVAPSILGLVHRNIRTLENVVSRYFSAIENQHTDAG